MALSLDAPIEDLKLSNRVRNALHHSGLHTVASVLKCDYRRALRGLGPGARAELAGALESHGFAPPASLKPSGIDDVAGDVSKLLEQMDASFRTWSARIEHFEMRIRKLTASGCGHQRRYRPAAEVAEQAHVNASIALAHVALAEPEKSLSSLPGGTNDGRKPADERTCVAVQLATEGELPPQAPRPANAVRLDEIQCPRVENTPGESRPHV